MIGNWRCAKFQRLEIAMKFSGSIRPENLLAGGQAGIPVCLMMTAVMSSACGSVFRKSCTPSKKYSYDFSGWFFAMSADDFKHAVGAEFFAAGRGGFEYAVGEQHGNVAGLKLQLL